MASTAGNAGIVHRSLQCGTRHIINLTTWRGSGGQLFPWERCYWLEAVKDLRRDPSQRRLCKAVAQATAGIIARADTELDTMNTDNGSEMKKEVEERKLHRTTKVHNVLEMWQGSQNLHATQKESCVQQKQMTAIGYISDTEDIGKASWSLFHHNGAAALTLSERSPSPPALSAKDLSGGRSQILNVC